MRNIFFILFIACKLTYSQTSPGTAGTENTANHWNFARIKALDFNSGYPVIISSSNESYGGSTVSDTLGNLLFYVNGKGDVYNKNHTLMQNGDLIPSVSGFPKQNILIIPVPESTDMYYIFTVGHEYDPFGLYYHKVDMSQNDGLGSVINTNIKLDAGVRAQSRLTAIRNTNGTDFWVITRLVFDSSYAVFEVSRNGVNPIPKKSPALYVTPIEIRRGEMKLSPDAKKIVSLENYFATSSLSLITVSDFNAESGIITDKFSVHQRIIGPYDSGVPEAAEFSPDSKFLYVGFQSDQEVFGNLIDQVWQYDMTMTDSISFIESGTHIKTLNNKRIHDVQSAPDGKIYVVQVDNVPNGLDSLDVINKPWEKGTNCDYVTNVIGLQTTTNETHGEPFPNFIQEQLYRFVYEGICAKVPVSFRHRFIPEPDSIVWNFGDGITSTDFNPFHVFQSGGNYEVHAHVVYPDGRIEETSREVEVLAAPEPFLGNDIQMCLSDTLELNAGPGFVQYNWNGQILPPGGQYYTVTDTGYYSIRVKNNLNCYGFDTIHVALYPQVYLDASGVDISPTTCNNSTGAIRGIKVSPAAVLDWRNSSGEFIGSTIDIENLPVGSYILTVTDTTGCVTVLPAITVNPADINVIIQDAPPGPALCGQDNGTISVKTSVFSDLLLFSKDDGSTWEDNLGTFSDLPAGNYWIMVKDALGCEIRYDKNPVKVEALGGPMVTFSGSTEASGSNPDGKITVIATGDSLSYMLNNVVQDTGYFTGLLSGDYVVQITDKYGCSIIVNVTVGELSGLSLSAITEGERKCIKQIVRSPVIVSNLKGVKDFRATINYNQQKITCTNLIEKALTEMTGSLYPGRVVLEWHGSDALGITDTLVIGKLLFETVQSGTADLRWETDTASTIFTDANGKKITANLKVNSDIEVSNPPTVMTSGDIRQCENSMAMISSFCFGGTEPFTYEWTKPDNEIKTESSIIVYLKPSTQGDYIIKVTDAYNCIVKDTLKVDVIQNPTAGFSSDTIPFVGEFRLQATPGFANYEWNTGETTDFINVTEGGKYYVIITNEGCTDTTFVVMKKLLEVDLKVPSAFTPNGDGLNDVFRPVMNRDLVNQYNLSVYNTWGQKIYETTDPQKGWEGTNASAGVYAWVITYSDFIGNSRQLKGSVALIR